MSVCLLHIYLVAVAQNLQCVEYSQDKLEFSILGVMVSAILPYKTEMCNVTGNSFPLAPCPHRKQYGWRPFG